MGGVFVPFDRSPNSSIALPGVKAPLRTHTGELSAGLVFELIPVTPMGVAVLLSESLITWMAAFSTAVVKVAVTVPAVPVAVPRKAYM